MLGLLREMLRDLYHISLRLGLEPFNPENITRDISYVEKRVGNEGLPFMTIVLPSLGKWFDRLLCGQWSPPPEGLKPHVDGYPLFLSTIIRPLSEVVVGLHILSNQTGSDARDEFHQASSRYSELVSAVRTLCYFAYKLEVDTPDDDPRSVAKLEQFVQTDADLIDPETDFRAQVPEFDQPLFDTAVDVFRECLRGFDLDITNPKHGPGAVASGERDEQKWVFSTLYETVHRSFPYYDYMYGVRSNGRALQLAATAARYRHMKRVHSPTAKVVLVPKDSRGPRIISCEPLELQYLQQGVATPMVKYLESTARCAGHVNFSDQSINGQLALASSLSGENATLDLSEASDRVSLSLVKAMLPSRLAKLLDLRSTHTQLPDGRVVELKKFAPMGSALCFPLEALVFYSFCVSSLIHAGMSRSDAWSKVYVYGDDIIVPSAYTPWVVEALTLAGLVVNEDKSYSAGVFRESCGVDAWLGHVVTPQRVRKMPGFAPGAGRQHLSWAAYASGFIQRNMRFAGEYCAGHLEAVLGPIPRTERTQGFLSIVDPENVTPIKGYGELRYDSDFQTCRAKQWVCRDKRRPSDLQEWERLAKDLLDPDLVDPGSVVSRVETQMSRKWVPIGGTLADWILQGL